MFNQIFSNRWIQLILILVIIFALLSFLGFHFHFDLGAKGMDAGVSR